MVITVCTAVRAACRDLIGCTTAVSAATYVRAERCSPYLGFPVVYRLHCLLDRWCVALDARHSPQADAKPPANLCSAGSVLQQFHHLGLLTKCRPLELCRACGLLVLGFVLLCRHTIAVRRRTTSLPDELPDLAPALRCAAKYVIHMRWIWCSLEGSWTPHRRCRWLPQPLRYSCEV